MRHKLEFFAAAFLLAFATFAYFEFWRMNREQRELGNRVKALEQRWTEHTNQPPHKTGFYLGNGNDAEHSRGRQEARRCVAASRGCNMTFLPQPDNRFKNQTA